VVCVIACPAVLVRGHACFLLGGASWGRRWWHRRVFPRDRGTP